MVVSRDGSLDTVWGGLSKSGNNGPGQSSGGTVSLRDWSGLVSLSISADGSAHDIEGSSLVELAILVGVLGQNSNIDPWGRSPVWVVILLLRALVSVSGSSGILSSVNGSVSI